MLCIYISFHLVRGCTDSTKLLIIRLLHAPICKCIIWLKIPWHRCAVTSVSWHVLSWCLQFHIMWNCSRMASCYFASDIGTFCNWCFATWQEDDDSQRAMPRGSGKQCSSQIDVKCRNSLIRSSRQMEAVQSGTNKLLLQMVRVIADLCKSCWCPQISLPD